MLTNSRFKDLILLRFKKLPTEKIYMGLDGGEWSDENKEAALIVLKMRGKDISKYLDDVPQMQVASSKLTEKLRALMDKILSSGTKSEIERLYELVKDVEDISKLPVETVEFIIKTLSSDGRSEESRIQSRYLRRQWKNAHPTKEEVLPYEVKRSLRYITENKKMSIKDRVLKLAEKGYTEAQIISLDFADKGYIGKILYGNRVQ